jgi:isopentenyldiphosphate isomerase
MPESFEIMYVVNDNDEVVGSALREDIYAKKLQHRIVHVLIFNDLGEMVLQLRSRNKSFCPHHWSTAVGGHVLSGESYEQAALRESEEEIGVRLPVRFAHKDVYRDPRGFNKFLVTYTARYNGPFAVGPEEVERAEYFSLEKIKEMVASGEKFHPELLFLLKKHYS